MLLRKVERFSENTWEVISMADIKAGDRFRLSEPDDLVVGAYDTPFFEGVAVSESTFENGTWGVIVN